MNTRSEHTPDGEAARVPADAEADGTGIVDFAPQCLPVDSTLAQADQLLAARGLWGVPLVDTAGDYAGMLTLRSLVAAALPVTLDAAPRRRLLECAARQFVDLEVPIVRVSTKLPQLLAVLCRRSPLVPIVADSGMRLLGVASLERAARSLYRS